MSEALFQAAPNPIDIVVDPADVEQRLQGVFGFGVAEVHSVLDAGHARAARATTQSAASQFGTDFYFGNVENLRTQLATRGYFGANVKNVEMARHPGNELQIATALGDDATGDRHKRKLGTKNPRGPVAKRLAQANQGNFGQIKPHPAWDEIPTWWLLYRVGPSEEDVRSIRSEISLPIDNTGKSFTWRTRIILPRFDLGPQTGMAVQPPASPPDIKVPVRLRAGNN